jgi:CRISP-associated protein Cas1
MTDPTPDYLPARMLNEYVYCPRLFYYEWVDGLFAHNRETVEGALRHAKLDSHSDPLASADELAPEDRAHARSVTLSSDPHRLIAKIDLVEAEGATVTPVDYKRGSPRKHSTSGELEAWPADRVQVAVQALVLRDNGYTCHEAVIYYVKTKQRVRVAIDDALIAQTLAAVADAFSTATSGELPPPLVDSPKCPRCSLVGICLPDETRFIQAIDDVPDNAISSTATIAATESDPPAPRRMVAARDTCGHSI